MSAEDAGSIYSEVRIRLDKLQSDITQAVNKLDQFGSNVVDIGNATSNLFSTAYSKSLKNVETYLSSLDGAVKSGAITQRQAIEQTIAIRKQELAYITATAAKKGGYTTQEIEDTKRVNAELLKLDATYKKLKVSEDEAGSSAQSFGAASVAAAAVIAVAFRSLVAVTSDYSAALAGVKAATRASAEDMERLAEVAAATAQVYGVTTTEALKGIEALSKAGVSIADIIGGGLSGAMALAAAGTMSVGDAAEAAAGIMTQFGKTGADVVHIADMLAAAAGNAIGEVSDFTAAFKQAGLVASKTGLTLEETTGTLAAFASNSLLGSDAGTSLKTMLANLTPVSAEAAALMKKLGFNAYDAKGAFLGVANVAEQLKNKIGGLTDAEKSEYLQTLFGNDGKRAAIVLMEQGAAGIDEWISKVNQSGFAAETARIKLDSLDGDLKKLTASAENSAVGLGDAATPALRTLAQAATFLLNAVNALPGPLKVAIVTIAGLTGAIIAFAAAGPAVIGVIKGIGVAAATSLGPFGLLASAISVVAIGFGSAAISAGIFANSTDRMIKNNAELIETTKKTNDEFSKIVGPVNDATKANKLSSEQIDKLKKLYPELTGVMNLNKATISEVTEAQKKLNEARNKETIATINNQISENNRLIEKQIKFTKDRTSAQSANNELFIKSSNEIIKNYEAQKQHTDGETRAYNAAKLRLAQIQESIELGNFDSGNIERKTSLLISQNRALAAQIKELDGSADAERAAAQAKSESIAAEKAAEAARKQAIEREIQARKDLTSDYEKSMAVYKQIFAEKLISEEDYYTKVKELANKRISDIETQAKKDGTWSKESRDATVKEIKVREDAQAQLDRISKSKADAAAKERELQSALDGTIESMTKERDAILALVSPTDAQIALRDKLSKKIIELQEKEKKSTERTQEDIRKAEEMTSNFRQSMVDGSLDAFDAAANKKKAALNKEVSDLIAANTLMLASNKNYADQTIAITKYAADQAQKIDDQTLTARVENINSYVNTAAGVLNGLLGALGNLYTAMNQQAMDALDATYEATIATLDAETQAKLEAAGLQEKTAVETAQASLDAAIASGDESAISAAQNELKKQQILEDAAKKKLAVDKQYAHDKAQLEYKASLESWNIQLLSAIVTGAQATMNAFSSGMQMGGIAGAVVFSALALVMTGIQIAAIYAAKPKPPTLATGGIAIPGPGGSNVIVAENGSAEMMLNGGASGEPFLNMFADKIAERIGGGQNKSNNITIINEIDRVAVSRSVVKDINNGVVRLQGSW